MLMMFHGERFRYETAPFMLIINRLIIALACVFWYGMPVLQG